MATILYVEDHPPAQLLMRAMVDDMTDHQLHVADSGSTAESLATSLKPDLYILDLDLPDTDGLTLAKTLQGIHAAPVILVSAYAEAASDSSENSVIDFYLAKPLDPDNVAEMIEKALKK